MKRNLRKVGVSALAVLVLALGVVGCGRGHKAGTAERPSPGQVSTGPTRTMRFQLADTSKGSVNAEIPDQPIGSVPSNIAGITLQLYLAKRQDPGAVLVVFALQISPPGVTTLDGSDLGVVEALSANYDTAPENRLQASVSEVGLLDPAGLKEYETFMADPSRDGTCLCSLIDPGLNNGTINPGTYYFAAFVAAPPPSVTSVSFVSGLGSIGNAKVSG